MTELVQSVQRALGLVEQLAGTDGDVSLTELARRTGLQAPTAHRLLRTLIDRDWVVRNPATSHYRLSYKLLAIAGGIEARERRLRSVARPSLEALRDATGESTNLVVLDGLAAVYIDQVAGTRPIRMFTEIGARVPAYASGAGKAMLAHVPAAVRTTLKRAPLEALTDRTMTEPAALQAELGRVRERGYAIDDEEYEIGVACIAAAIVTGDGKVAGAISVSAPAARSRALDRAHLGRQLAEHARAIADQLDRT